jgi:N-acetylmuramoyl-L-alanine amidase
MRKITHIVIHCTATPMGREVSAKEIDRMHRQRGFAKIGYHYVIHLDGSVSEGRKLEEPGAHVAGHNATTIGISYVGGVDANDINKALDTRTAAQRDRLLKLVAELKSRFPAAEVLGHRDFPGVAKACPCFDTRKWWAEASKGAAPKAPAPAPDGVPAKAHKVARGETLYSIAKKYGSTVGKIAAVNPGINVNALKIGQVINLP